ncbi:ParB-like nuclease family protein [Streptomyces sp. Amel2xB2]|uniref:ParB N-terminal domain-containing protein n=1 Tax=Streptomyces sp. Amel2xB2 TaxID=1305829 RepID=UPI000DC04138|nr:ParB N-terminal domain-containing protein [Streptomyces sp. Amel2xB2]RAJ67167.1 ParB-like nuclease family protein [Streptomyces sp. Amel2xB2]
MTSLSGDHLSHTRYAGRVPARERVLTPVTSAYEGGRDAAGAAGRPTGSVRWAPFRIEESDDGGSADRGDGEDGEDGRSEYAAVSRLVRLHSTPGGEAPAPAVVPVAALRASDSPRLEGENSQYVRQLAESAAPLPPLLVDLATMRVIDGMHRLRALELRGEEYVQVQFLDERPQDLFAVAVGVNAAHGRPLSRADRVAAAARILVSHPHWSDRHVAELAALAPSTVGAIRERSTDHIEPLNARVGKDGRTRPMDAAEGRIRASEVITANPRSTLREIAKTAGISVATAKDVRDRMRQGKDPLPPRLRGGAARTSEAGATAGATATVPAASAATAAATATAATTAAAAVQREPGSVVRIHRAVPQSAFNSLLRDPSMRTDAGRALLHLMRCHLLDDEEKRRWLMDCIPEHCRATVAQGARDCAEQWLRLAGEMEKETSAGPD